MTERPVHARRRFVGALQRGLIGLLMGVFLANAAAAAPEPQRLADFRRVVVADKALYTTKAAAEELAHYAGRILDQKIPVVVLSKYDPAGAGLSFFVGTEAAEQALGVSLGPWKHEEHLLRSLAKGLALAGDDGPGRALSSQTKSGTALAVYTLLDEHLGVKWFWPGDSGEHVPQNPTAQIPALDRRTTPRFAIRSYSVGYGSYHLPQFKEEAEKWARRSRLGWSMPAVFGHSWYNAFNLRNPEEALAAHPDWFALVNGKRQPPQMCTTHPEVLDRMVEYVLADKKNVITNISPSDGGGFCQCNEQTKSEAHKRAGAPSCTSLDVPGILSYDGKTTQLSDRIFTYANEIARRVRAQNPDKGVGMFAYTFYNKPPVNIQRLEPNVFLSFVCQAAANRDPQVRQEWSQTIEAWQQKGAKMVLREGWGNHYYLDLPGPHWEQIIDTIAEADRRGFMACYGEGTKAFATHAPNTWAVVRMVWNPSQDPKAVMDEYFQTAYGPAAKPMRDFFETYKRALDENWAKRRFVSPSRGLAYANVINSWHLWYPPSVVEEAEKHMRLAEQAAPAGEYARRVALHRIGQDYTHMMLELLDCYRQLAELDMKMDFFSVAVEQPQTDEPRKQQLLRRAYELGMQRENMLLAHRELPALDEGLLAFTNDSKNRQWHVRVKEALGIHEPSKLTKALLAPPKAKPSPKAAE